MPYYCITMQGVQLRTLHGKAGFLLPGYRGPEQAFTVNGYLAKFYIRTEPFSEAFLEKPKNEEEEPFGIVSERNFPHPYTLKTGEYECLVVERLRHTQEGRFVKDTVYMIVLDWVISQDGRGDVAERRTFVTVQSDVKFEKVKPVKRVVHLE